MGEEAFQKGKTYYRVDNVYAPFTVLRVEYTSGKYLIQAKLAGSGSNLNVYDNLCIPATEELLYKEYLDEDLWGGFCDDIL